MAVKSDRKTVKGAKKPKSARDRLGLLLEKDPKNADAHFELGQLLALSAEERDKEASASHLEKALALRKDFAEAAETLAGVLLPNNKQKAARLYNKAAGLYRKRGNDESGRD
jgi:hypothetical protein